jgi:hypothetical protein
LWNATREKKILTYPRSVTRFESHTPTKNLLKNPVRPVESRTGISIKPSQTWNQPLPFLPMGEALLGNH